MNGRPESVPTFCNAKSAFFDAVCLKPSDHEEMHKGVDRQGRTRWFHLTR